MRVKNTVAPIRYLFAFRHRFRNSFNCEWIFPQAIPVLIGLLADNPLSVFASYMSDNEKFTGIQRDSITRFRPSVFFTNRTHLGS
jgi:hypothetical protein